MKIYLPKIIATSPTNLPLLEKTLLYYIIDSAFKDFENVTTDNMLELNLKELLEVLNNTSLDLFDIVTQTKNSLHNLSKVKLSLVDNGLHIKVSPIKSIFISSGVVYVSLNSIIIEYLDQVFIGNYEVIDLCTIR